MAKTLRLKHLNMALGTIFLIAGWTHLASAQYVISAKAGLVNHTQGQVLCRTSAGAAWEKVTQHLQLHDGDRVATKRNGRAEILLNPGSYLRIDNNTEVALLETDLSLIEFEILSGSAIIEAGDLNKAVRIRVKTPQTALRIKQDGLYRIDVEPNLSKVLVRKGELEILTQAGAKKLKKGKEAGISETSLELARLEKKDALDDFDLWAKDRAEILIASNQSLMRRRDFARYGLYASSWVYDPFFGYYTFVPFGYFYRSPWGRSFIYFCPYFGYWPGYYGGGYYWGGGNNPIARPNQPPAMTLNESKATLRVGGVRADRGDVYASRPMTEGRGGRIIPYRDVESLRGGGMSMPGIPMRGGDIPMRGGTVSSPSAGAPVVVSPAPPAGGAGGTKVKEIH